MAPPKKTVVLDVVGLTRGLISAEHTPFLERYLSQTDVLSREIEPAFPALTCPAQSTYLTGAGPAAHGVTANGFYDRTYCEVKNWHQSAKVVKAPRIWDALKASHPDATVFVNGLWQGMHDPNIDYFINVRPQYLQNGGKVADVYTKPATLREHLQDKGRLGTFPMHRYWGPGTSIESSRWIADASIAVDKKHNPTLTFMYLPHLDYSLQKYGPPVPAAAGRVGTGEGKGKRNEEGDGRVVADLGEIDKLVQELVEYYESEQVGARVVILSEYGISRVDRPVYLNRVLRENGLVQVRRENGGETLDCGECRAFALCDHQVAHVHVQDPCDVPLVRRILESTPGVEKVMNGAELDDYYRQQGGERRKAPDAGGTAAGVHTFATATGYFVPANGSRGAHHAERSGELVAISDSRSWFAYYYWNDDNMAPDFARCVAIHRKPGYDPAEMFFRFPGIRGFAWLMFKLFLTYGLKLRTIVDATPLKCDGIRGSHGRLPLGENEARPLLAFRKGGDATVTAEAAGEEKETEANQAADGVLVEGVDVPSAAGSGGLNELGREGCLSQNGNVVAEDVYEVLWRVLAGEI